jgi:hypothetical protein
MSYGMMIAIQLDKRREAGKSWPPYRSDRTPHPVTVGPMVDEAHTMIRFVPETNVSGTDASYHLPAFYELWVRERVLSNRVQTFLFGPT